MAHQQESANGGNGLMPDHVRDMLPWYVNGTLSPAEQEAVEAWLARHPEAYAEVEALRALHRAVAAQPTITPPKEVWNRLRAHVGRQQMGWPRWLVWAWGSVLAVGIFLLLWALVQPGIVLRWQVNSTDPAVVRVWRVVGEGDLVPLAMISLSPNQRVGAFVDSLVRPWKTYTYRVEVWDKRGQLAWGRTVVAPARGVWLYLASIAIISFMGGWAVAWSAFQFQRDVWFSSRLNKT